MITLREAIANSHSRGGPPPVDPNQWDVTSLGAGMTITGSGLIVTRTGGGGFASARSVGQCPATSDRYFKVTLAGPTSSPFQLCGISTAGLNPAAYPGSDTSGYGYYEDTGELFRNAVGAAFGANYTSGDTILFAYKGSASQLFVRKNSTWQNGGDPSTGTGAVSVVSAGYYAAVGIYNTGNSFTADLTSVDADPLLAGFTPWVP